MLYTPLLLAKPHKLQILSGSLPMNLRWDKDACLITQAVFLIFQVPVSESHLVIFIMYILI